MLAKKNTPFNVIIAVSFVLIPIINHDILPAINAVYPNSIICDATKNAPIIETIVPNHLIIIQTHDTF